jgi:O-antigen/teichoic acid export membrane protein
MISQMVTWGLTLLLTVFLPRYLGAAAMGKLHLGYSLWAMITILAVFGMDMMIIKEVARRPDRIAALFGTTIYLRMILYGAGTLLIAAYANIAGYPVETRYVIYIIGVSNFISLFTGACDAILVGLERMEFVSLGSIAAKFAQTFVTLLLLFLGYGILVIAAIVIGGSLINLALVAFSLRRLTPLSLRFDPTLAKWMVKESSSYLMVRFAIVVYQQVDIVIISLLVDEKNVGWYGTADQLFGTFLFVPTVFITAVYPVLSRTYANEPDSVAQIIRKSFDIMWLAAVPIGLGVVLVASPLVVLLFGSDFASAGPILAVFGVVTILTYQNMMLGQFLISTDRQRPWSRVIALAAVLTIPLDLIFIPLGERQLGIGAVGGAMSFVITELLMMIAALYLLPKGYLTWDNAQRALRVLASGLVMLAAVWWLRGMFILIPILAGAAVFVAAILFLQAVPNEDWALLRSVANNLIGRLRRKTAQPANASGKN